MATRPDATSPVVRAEIYTRISRHPGATCTGVGLGTTRFLWWMADSWSSGDHPRQLCQVTSARGSGT